MKNKGIIQYGGEIHANQLSVGHNAKNKIVSHEKENDDLQSENILLQIQKLRDTIKYDTSTSNLPNKEELLKSVDEISDIINKKEGKKINVLAILEKIAKSTGAIGSIVKLILELKKLIVI